MRIYTLNIRQGGGIRIPSIVAAVQRCSPDVVILTEFRLGKTGERLQRLLDDAGFSHQVHSHPPPGTNSVLLVSKSPLSLEDLCVQHHRLIPAQVDDLVVLGVYLPLHRPKVEFWTSYLQPALDELFSRASIVVGDFNTGDERDREARTRFYAESLFKQNLAGGWVSAWHSIKGDDRDYTWRSRAHNGFLIDHLWLSPSAEGGLKSAFISHFERDTGVSDHSALVVDLDTEELVRLK